MKVLAFRHVPFEDVGHIRPVLGIARRVARVRRPLPPGTAAPDISVADAPDLHGRTDVGERRAAVSGDRDVADPRCGAPRTAGLRRMPGRATDREGAGRAACSPTRKRRSAGSTSSLRRRRATTRFSAGWIPRLKIFQWHGETFDLPEGATLLASSAACRNQAFRLGAATLRHPVPSRGDAGNDRRLVPSGRQLRRCLRIECSDRSPCSRAAPGGTVGPHFRTVDSLTNPPPGAPVVT